LSSDDNRSGQPLDAPAHQLRPWRGYLCPALAGLAALIALGASSASAQSLGRTEDLTRQQTVDLIAHILADVQANFPSPAQALSLEQAVVQRQLADSATKIMDLRDALSDNNHIMIRTFSIDLPSGVSVQFDFPPEDRGE
jgi:hypothetical protein